MSPSASGLGTISTEILRLITASLDSKDLKKLRTVSKGLNAVSSETLFKAITLSPDPQSIVQLLKVSSSSVWASQVRHVNWILVQSCGIISCLRFPGTPLVQLQDLDAFPGLREAVQPALKLTTKTKCEHYALVDLQCHLLRKMVNIQTIRFQCADEAQGRAEKPGKWKKFIKTISFVCDDGRQWRQLMLERKHIMHMSFDIFGVELFELTLRSGASPSRIETLHVSVCPTYSEKGYIEAVCITQRCEYTQHSEAGLQEEHEVFFEKWKCVELLAQLKTLKRVTLRWLNITPHEVWPLVEMNTGLEELNVEFCRLIRRCNDVVPAGYVHEHHDVMISAGDLIAGFILRSMILQKAGKIPNLKISVVSIGCRGFAGWWSASPEKFRLFLNGCYDTFILEAANQFYHDFFNCKNCSNGAGMCKSLSP